MRYRQIDQLCLKTEGKGIFGMAIDIQRCVNRVSEELPTLAVSGGMGYLCARVFLTIDPVHAAVFSASAALISKIITPFFEDNFNGWAASDASRLTGRLLAMMSSIAMSAGVSTVLGFPISLGASAALAGTIFVVSAVAAAAIDVIRGNRGLIRV